MDDSYVRDVRQGTTHRELIPSVIEQPIIVSTESIVRLESGADAPRKRAFTDERLAVWRPNGSHKV